MVPGRRVDPDVVVGGLVREGAHARGLEVGTPVVAGGVDAARDDGRPHLEAARVRPFAHQPAHHHVRIDAPPRHHRRPNPPPFPRLVGPVSPARSADASKVGRRAVTDREPARQPIRQHPLSRPHKA
ncbi:hypothetical protein, partial [Burkholderia pseudomallei]|uniref:hypothetical protein n=1 Tax=Burkholderia pseudomallei TaxID=28450 RepID=UPI000CCE0ECA